MKRCFGLLAFWGVLVTGTAEAQVRPVRAFVFTITSEADLLPRTC